MLQVVVCCCYLSSYLSTLVKVEGDVPDTLLISCFVDFFHFLDELFPRCYRKQGPLLCPSTNVRQQLGTQTRYSLRGLEREP